MEIRTPVYRNVGVSLILINTTLYKDNEQVFWISTKLITLSFTRRSILDLLENNWGREEKFESGRLNECVIDLYLSDIWILMSQIHNSDTSRY